MRLADVVALAVPDTADPAAALALAYAEQIDDCTHVRVALAEALDTLLIAAQLADGGPVSEDGADLRDRLGDTHVKAYRKVAAALAAVTVVSDLGPKLLATLDALVLTPKAKAAANASLNAAAPAGSKLARMRANHDSRHLRAVG